MSIIVEDGTGLATAETYISVADADTYFSNRGVTDWASLSTAVKEQSLRKSTDDMIGRYRNRWQGVRLSETQALDWPRQGVVVDSWSVPSDEVPTEVARACAQLALKANTEVLSPDLEQGKIKEKVDVIEVEYDQYSPQKKRFTAVDNMLAPFLKPGGGVNVELLR